MHHELVIGVAVRMIFGKDSQSLALFTVGDEESRAFRDVKEICKDDDRTDLRFQNVKHVFRLSPKSLFETLLTA